MTISLNIRTIQSSAEARGAKRIGLKVTGGILVPLSRSTVTAASRIMLPVYPCLAGYMGAAYLLGDPARTATPSFEFAQDLLPMWTWGLVFLSIATLLTAGLVLHSRDVTIFVLSSAAMAFVIWSACFLVSLFITPDASLMGPIWPLFAAVCCIASAVSVSKREVQS